MAKPARQFTDNMQIFSFIQTGKTTFGLGMLCVEVEKHHFAVWHMQIASEKCSYATVNGNYFGANLHFSHFLNVHGATLRVLKLSVTFNVKFNVSNNQL